MKNKKMFILALVILFSAFTGKVNALKIRQEAVVVDGVNVVKVYRNLASQDPSKYRVGGSRDMMLTITDDNGNNPIIVYCVDFGTPIGMNSWDSPDSATAGVTMSLDDFLATKISNASRRQELIQKLNFIYYYGYSASGSRNTPRYYLATQALVWQTLSDYGMYTSLTAEQVKDLYTTDEEYSSLTRSGDFELADISFQKYPFPPSQYNYNTRIIEYNASDVLNLSAEKNSINTAITNYTNKKPSFCGNNLQLMPGEEKVLTDSNNVFQYYDEVTCENATCTKNGNTLTVKAPLEEGNISIKYSRSEGLNIDSKVYRVSDGGQGVAVAGGKLPTVNCELTGKITEEPTPDACYVCGTGNDSDYFWGDYSDDPSCELQEQITSEANCKVVSPPTSGLKIAYISLMCGMAAAVAFVYFYSKKPKSEYCLNKHFFFG